MSPTTTAMLVGIVVGAQVGAYGVFLLVWVQAKRHRVGRYHHCPASPEWECPACGATVRERMPER